MIGLRPDCPKISKSRIFKILTLLLCLSFLSFSACRFKSPSVAEQKELAKRGAFPSGAPAWVGGSGRGEGMPVKNSGAIPEKFATPLAVSTINPAGDRVGLEVEESLARLTQEESTTLEIEDTPEQANSPLKRIAGICPGVDLAAEEAIVTENRSVRIQKYQELLKRCPMSPDILTWLGTDYLNAGQRAEAESAARKALSIDSNFADAQGLLQRLNNSSDSN